MSASTKNAQDLADFESTLLANNLPLSKWKEEERRFLDQMMEGKLDQRDIKNPYEPPPNTGKCIISLHLASNASGSHINLRS